MSYVVPPNALALSSVHYTLVEVDLRLIVVCKWYSAGGWVIWTAQVLGIWVRKCRWEKRWEWVRKKQGDDCGEERGWILGETFVQWRDLGGRNFFQIFGSEMVSTRVKDRKMGWKESWGWAESLWSIANDILSCFLCLKAHVLQVFEFYAIINLSFFRLN